MKKPKHKPTNATIARAPLAIPTGGADAKIALTNIVEVDDELAAELANKAPD